MDIIVSVLITYIIYYLYEKSNTKLIHELKLFKATLEMFFFL